MSEYTLQHMQHVLHKTSALCCNVYLSTRYRYMDTQRLYVLWASEDRTIFWGKIQKQTHCYQLPKLNLACELAAP